MRWLADTKIDFIGKRYTFFVVSSILILVTFGSIIFHGGLNLGIDFTGGILVQVHFDKQLNISDIRKTLSESSIKNFQLQDFPQHNSVIIRVKGNQAETIASEVNNAISRLNIPFNIERTEYVGPVIGKYLSKQAFMAIVFSLLGIVIYVAFRFKSSIWGVSGVIALLHDVLITIGLFSVLDREITITIIAALLTLAGYSINDTIVIFDRIRENLTLVRKESIDKTINISVNQTLSRTIITSLTVEMVLLALFLFGGEVIHDFSLALLFGCIIGTYSTIFIASPLVYEWLTYRSKHR